MHLFISASIMHKFAIAMVALFLLLKLCCDIFYLTAFMLHTCDIYLYITVNSADI